MGGAQESFLGKRIYPEKSIDIEVVSLFWTKDIHQNPGVFWNCKDGFLGTFPKGHHFRVVCFVAFRCFNSARSFVLKRSWWRIWIRWDLLMPWFADGIWVKVIDVFDMQIIQMVLTHNISISITIQFPRILESIIIHNRTLSHIIVLSSYIMMIIFITKNKKRCHHQHHYL